MLQFVEKHLEHSFEVGDLPADLFQRRRCAEVGSVRLLMELQVLPDVRDRMIEREIEVREDCLDRGCVPILVGSLETCRQQHLFDGALQFARAVRYE
ncbi:MAG TPA: hypothetical protein VNN08_02355 [Thermoanaerobaculia bacterium]|nr:hypothetical protein [Thermoanaerobaculia bacterium]